MSPYRMCNGVAYKFNKRAGQITPVVRVINASNRYRQTRWIIARTDSHVTIAAYPFCTPLDIPINSGWKAGDWLAKKVGDWK